MNVINMTAGEFIESHEDIVVWRTSTACPSGSTFAVTPDTDLGFSADVLNGTCIGTRWEWDGSGSPSDPNGNTITNIVIYSSRTEWSRLVVDCATSDGIDQAAKDYCLRLGVTPEEYAAIAE